MSPSGVATAASTATLNAPRMLQSCRQTSDVSHAATACTRISVGTRLPVYCRDGNAACVYVIACIVSNNLLHNALFRIGCLLR